MGLQAQHTGMHEEPATSPRFRLAPSIGVENKGRNARGLAPLLLRASRHQPWWAGLSRRAAPLALILSLAACANSNDAVLDLLGNDTASSTAAAPVAGAAPPPSSTGRTATPPAALSESDGNGKQDTASFFANLRKKIDAAFTPDQPSRAERQRLGDNLARKVLGKARLANDRKLRSRVRGIINRLALAAKKESPWPAEWRVHVVAEKSADAFTAGGGHLFVTTGMLRLLQTDERIATVLAHEMAHNLLGHVWAAKEKKDMARRAHRFSREVLAGKMRLPWLGESVSFLVNTSLNAYSRQQEYDADAEGLHLLVLAGYQPQVALETFDYLRQHFREEAALKNFFHSNHPLYKRRRWYLANRIRAYYRAQAGLPPVRRANWKSGR